MSGLINKSVTCNAVRYITQVRSICNSSNLRSDKVPEKYLPKNLIPENLEQPKGEVYDAKPFKMKLEANKKYSWCCCGHSKSQPLCDGTHKIENLKIKIKPVLFMVDETKEYWICNCKQTLHRPFCDGTHKKESVKNQIKKKILIDL